MGLRGVGEHRRELPVIAVRPQDRQPRFIRWIKAARRDLLQIIVRSPFAVFGVDFQQQFDRRACLGMSAAAVCAADLGITGGVQAGTLAALCGAAEHPGECCADTFQTAFAKAAKRSQTAIMGGLFQFFQRANVELLHSTLCQFLANAGDAFQRFFWRDVRFQIIQQGRAARCHQFPDQASDPVPDIRQVGQVINAILTDICGQLFICAADRLRGLTIGTHPKRICVLRFQQIGQSFQNRSDLPVTEFFGHFLVSQESYKLPSIIEQKC